MSYERAAEAAGKAAYASAGGTFVAGISLNEWAAIVGIFATLATVLMNWYYKQRHFELAQRHAGVDGDEG